MWWSIFRTILEMSMAASITAFILIFVKFILHKLSFPRRYLMLLWIVIVIRLVCPCNFQSDFSLFNIFNNQAKQAVRDVKIENSKIHINIANAEPDIMQKTESFKSSEKDYKNAILAMWIFGILAMNTYSIIKTRRLKRNLRYSIKIAANVYEADNIYTSFVTGFFRPIIYIPSFISYTDKQNMLIHEKTHIKYMHNRLKIIFYIILSVHWFNPVVWLLFHLICADMEYACDEISVDNVHKKAYMTTLLNAGSNVGAKIIPPHLCSFSSLSKRRIVSLAKYKKKSKLYVLASIAVFIVLVFVLCTSAKDMPYASKADLAMPYSLISTFEKQEAIKEIAFAENTAYKKEENAKSVATPPEPEEKDENIPQKKANKYKSSEKSDMLYGGVELLEPEGINGESLCFELERNNIKSTSADADLKKNYIKKSYLSTPEEVIIPSVSCDENGNISLYISLNGDSLFEVRVYDSQTKDIVHSSMVLANGKNAFSLLGFEMDKKYDISLKEATNGEWKTEGYYIIY